MDSTPPSVPPALPESLSIPNGMLEKWFGFQPQEYIDFRVTREDLDKLFLAINQSIQSQSAMDQAFVDWTNGRTQDADQWMFEARRLRVESGNALRRFFMAIMASSHSAGMPNE